MDAKELVEIIRKYKETFVNYKEKFLADGIIDTSEQEQLDRVEKALKNAEDVLSSLKKKNQPQQELSTETQTTVLSWQNRVETWLNANKNKVKDHFLSLAIGLNGIGYNIYAGNKFDFIISELTSTDDQLWSIPPFTLQSYIEDWAKRNAIGTITSQEIMMNQIIEDNKWQEHVENWLKNKNADQILLSIIFVSSDDPKEILKIIEDNAKKAMNEIAEIKSVSVESVSDFISDYLSDKDVVTKSIIQSPAVKSASELEKLFAKIKKLGKFDWKFAAGKLEIKIDGPSAVFAYKPDDKTKIELGADKGGVSLKAESKVGDAKLDAKVSTDFEGKINVSAAVKIEELFDFLDSKGSASIAVKGDAKSWGVEFTLASSRGTEAHLSKNAADKLVETIQEAANALGEVYKILETEEITIDNFSEIKEKAQKQWEKLSTALSSLDAVAKTPVSKPEIYVSFGLEGDFKGDVSVNFAFTFTF